MRRRRVTQALVQDWRLAGTKGETMMVDRPSIELAYHLVALAMPARPRASVDAGVPAAVGTSQVAPR